MTIRKFITIIILVAATMTTEASELPKEVAEFRDAISSIEGVSEVEIDKIYLPDVSVEDLSLPGPYADLPIATLRRSKGGLKNEILVSAMFRIERNEAGLKALEFLAWWVRDLSRGGKNIQIRAIGLPPIAGENKQLGRTLRFSIDFFFSSPKQDMKEVLNKIGELAKSLNLSRRLYSDAF
jgi:hypothetical protein